MTYEVRLRPRAKKELQKISTQDQKKITLALRLLQENPRPPGVKKLRGREGAYRVRVGDYRVIFEINDGELLVLVIRIGHRGDVYGR